MKMCECEGSSKCSLEGTTYGGDSKCECAHLIKFNTDPKIVQPTQEKCEWGDEMAPLVTCEYGV